jgi:hypothetical protein
MSKHSEKPRPTKYWLVIRLLQLAVSICVFGLTLDTRFGIQGKKLDERDTTLIDDGDDEDDHRAQVAAAVLADTVSLRVLFITVCRERISPTE